MVKSTMTFSIQHDPVMLRLTTIISKNVGIYNMQLTSNKGSQGAFVEHKLMQLQHNEETQIRPMRRYPILDVGGN